MASLLERIDRMRPSQQRSSIDLWIDQYLAPTAFSFGNAQYPAGLRQTLTGVRVSEIAASLPGYFAALRTCPPAFAAQLVRASVLSGARFTFRNTPAHPRTPRRLWSSSALAPLERPWPNATTGELVSRMEWCAGLTGNAFVVRQTGRLRVLRPDWTMLVYGSQREPDDPGHAIDGQLIGYVYTNGGPLSGNQPVQLLPVDVAHWSPLPDPQSPGLGMSWITPAIREIQADRAATEHKVAYFANGATPNLVIKGIPATSQEQFNQVVDLLEQRHTGVGNAFRTLYLTLGVDATVVGSDLGGADLRAVQGAGETRIASLSRVPASLLGISEGLAGSSLNAGNFSAARRIFADSWIWPTLQDLAAALAPLVDVPSDSELWVDTADMPILREDAKDAAEIEQVKATTIRQLVDGGFDPDSVIAAVTGQDMKLLRHSGLVSVQLNPPGAGNGQLPSQMPQVPSNGNQPA